MRLLVVEDNPVIANAIKEGLENESYAVDIAQDGEEGYLSATSETYDLLLLDILMPKMNGIELCKKLREENIATPIIMLTAKGQKNDIIAGLDSGADDYVSKPFDFDELLARVRALLRRPPKKNDEVLRVSDLELHPNNKKVIRGEKEIKLTAKEYALLEYLMRNQGTPLTKNEIIQHVWDFESNVMPNNVELFIMFLRRKIDKPFSEKLIQTVSGFGYKIQGDDS